MPRNNPHASSVDFNYGTNKLGLLSISFVILELTNILEYLRFCLSSRGTARHMVTGLLRESKLDSNLQIPARLCSISKSG
jgi:hypothetical protein